MINLNLDKIGWLAILWFVPLTLIALAVMLFVSIWMHDVFGIVVCSTVLTLETAIVRIVMQD